MKRKRVWALDKPRKRVVSASHLTQGGRGGGGVLGEDRSGNLGAGLPALALRFLPSLRGRRQRGV